MQCVQAGPSSRGQGRGLLCEPPAGEVLASSNSWTGAREMGNGGSASLKKSPRHTAGADVAHAPGSGGLRLPEAREEEEEQFLPPCVVRTAPGQGKVALRHFRGGFELPPFVSLTVDDAVHADQLLLYQRKVDELAHTLPSNDAPYERHAPRQAPQGKSLGPEDDGVMLRLTSCFVPSPSCPYQPAPSAAKLAPDAPPAPPPPPIERSKDGLANLQYVRCGQCKVVIVFIVFRTESCNHIVCSCVCVCVVYRAMVSCTNGHMFY